MAFFTFRAILYLALCALAHSLVFKSEDVHVNFDDRKGTPSAFKVNYVGIHAGLRWEGFYVDKPHPGEKGQEFVGVEVHSEPNYAGAEWDELFAPPSISSQFFGSNVAFFDFERFFWGCATTGADGRQVPEWCSLDILGYIPASEEPLARTSSIFTPGPNQQSMAMVEAILPPDFNALSRVEFVVQAKSPILYLDDVRLRQYNVTAIGTGLNEVHHAEDESSQSEFHIKLMGHDGPGAAF